MPLSTEDQKHLTAAQGFTELGMWLDANAELEEIDPEVRHFPEVLEVRVRIYRALEKWELMQTVAKKLTEVDPTDSRWPLAWAYATRRAESVDAARFILIAAWELHEKEPLIPYNIACYMCQLGQNEIAKGMLEVAFKLSPEMRAAALDDEDLKPMWDQMAGMRMGKKIAQLDPVEMRTSPKIARILIAGTSGVHEDDAPHLDECQ